MRNFLRRNGNASAENGADTTSSLIDLRAVKKAYDTPTGPFLALHGVDLQVERGEFVAVIGKSGSGKSTLINMITGIDRPTSGEVAVAGTRLVGMSEGDLAAWRGRNVGVVFQFFQLLPTLTNLENVILPMDFCGLYSAGERRERALHLLDEVGIVEHARKLPSEISGGQQQRVAIARALATDPPIIVADEPTGNLDSKTAEAIFELFERLVEQGKTILIVTHDRDLARRVSRTIILADGDIVDEFLARIFPAMSEDLLVQATRQLATRRFEPGEVIIRAGEQPDTFYLITQGEVEVHIPTPGGDVVGTRLSAGQCFGEVELLRGGRNIASIVASYTGVDAATLDRATFEALIAASPNVQKELDRLAAERLAENIATRTKK